MPARTPGTHCDNTHHDDAADMLPDVEPLVADGDPPRAVLDLERVAVVRILGTRRRRHFVFLHHTTRRQVCRRVRAPRQGRRASADATTRGWSSRIAAACTCGPAPYPTPRSPTPHVPRPTPRSPTPHAPRPTRAPVAGRRCATRYSNNAATHLARKVLVEDVGLEGHVLEEGADDDAAAPVLRLQQVLLHHHGRRAAAPQLFRALRDGAAATRRAARTHARTQARAPTVHRDTSAKPGEQRRAAGLVGRGHERAARTRWYSGRGGEEAYRICASRAK